MERRKYTIKIINKGWFKKDQKPHNFGKPLSLAERKKLSRKIKKVMAKLPESIQRKIRKTQFKKGNYYAHWTGKYSEEHPRYTGRAYRNKALHQKKIKCEECGRKKFTSLRQLHVHHKDKNIKNNNITNLQLLCSKCHTHHHKNWKYKKRCRLRK